MLQKLLHIIFATIANKCVVCYSIDLMGDIRGNRLHGARKLLAIAITEREISNFRELFRERNFYQKINLVPEFITRQNSTENFKHY